MSDIISKKIYAKIIEEFKRNSFVDNEIDKNIPSKKAAKVRKKYNKYRIITRVVIPLIIAVSGGVGLYVKYISNKEKHNEENDKIKLVKIIITKKIQDGQYTILNENLNSQNNIFNSMSAITRRIEFLLSEDDPDEKDFDKKFQSMMMDLVAFKGDLIRNFGDEAPKKFVDEYSSVINKIEIEIIKSKVKHNTESNIAEIRKPRNDFEDYLKSKMAETKAKLDSITFGEPQIASVTTVHTPFSPSIFTAITNGTLGQHTDNRKNETENTNENAEITSFIKGLNIEELKLIQ